MKYPSSNKVALLLLLVWLPFFSFGKTSSTQHQQHSFFGFIENKGQVIDQYNQYRSDIDFQLEDKTISIFVGNGQIHYQWRSIPDDISPISKNGDFSQNKDKYINFYRLDATLVGANPVATLLKQEQQVYYENYYLPQCPRGAVAHSFKKMIYTDIYPNIDWVLYINGSELKYDFVVRPGGDPALIKIKYEGATSLKQENGSIIIATPSGSITENAPYCYEMLSGKKVESSFHLEENILSFSIGHFEQTLVVDPRLLWATYFGGSGSEFCNALAEDTAKNVYIAGCTNSTLKIATTGAFQVAYSAGSNNVYDGFLAKYTKDDTLVWSTYYGGKGIERGSSVACDPFGNIYFSGVTGILSASATGSNASDTVLATNGTFYRDSGDVFLAKFDSTGHRIWGTYYGGHNVDDLGVLACDDTGNVFMAGWTLSYDSMSTAGAYQVNHMGVYSLVQYDGFLVKYNGAGLKQWGTYYGGDSLDRIEAIACDHSGNVYVAGFTMSDNNITGSGSVTSLSGPEDGFITCFNGLGLYKFATLYVGDNNDEIYSLALDNNANIYVGGITNSNSGIALGTSFQSLRGGGYDGFIGKLNSIGQRQWGSYLGGAGNEEVWGICTNALGSVFVSMRTESGTGLPVVNGFQLAKGGTGSSSDAFIAGFGTDGNIQWGSYYGGPGDEDINVPPGYGNANILYSKTGCIYTCGNTASQAGIPFNTAHQAIYGGGPTDAYLARIYNDTVVYIYQPFLDTQKCVGDTFYLNVRTTNFFNSDNTFNVQLSNSTGNFTNPLIIGSKNATNNDVIRCIIPVSLAASANYRIRVLATSPRDTSDDNGTDIRVSLYPEPVTSASSPVCEGASLNLFVNSIVPVNFYIWTGPNGFLSTNFYPVIQDVTLAAKGMYHIIVDNFGCKTKDSVNVVILPRPVKPVLVASDTSLCLGDSLFLFTATDTGITYNWQTPLGYFPTTPNTRSISHTTVADSGIYRIATVFDFDHCASASDTINIAVHPIPAPKASNSSPVCAGSGFMIHVADQTPGVSFSWTGPNGYNHNGKDTGFQNASSLLSGSYLVTASAFGCIGTDSTFVVVKPTPAKPDAFGSSPICAGNNLNLNATDSVIGVSFSWSGPHGFSSSLANPILANAQTTTSGIYLVTVGINGCQKSDSVDILVKPTPKPSISSNSPVFEGDDIELAISNPSSSFDYYWTGPNGFISRAADTTLHKVTAAATGSYTLTVVQDGCVGSAVTDVQVNDQDTSYFVLYPNPNNGNFTVKGHTHTDQHPQFNIFGAAGQLVYTDGLQTSKKFIKKDISLSAVASGVYFFKVRIDGIMKNIPFTVKR